MGEYLLDNAAPAAALRFSALEATLDPVTIRHLDARGVCAGWRCLEVGAGSGSIARWLAARVGSTGRVVATDLATEKLRVESGGNIEVRIHDIVRDPLEKDAFDLVHARLVLVHLRERDEVLAKLVAALRPNGWLVLEEFTHALPAVPVPETELERTFNRVQDAFVDALHARGADTVEYPRTLVRRLRASGLNRVGGEGFMAIAHGGSPGADIYRSGFLQVGDQLVAAGAVSSKDVAACIRALEDPSFVVTLPALVSAWGQKWR